MQHTQANDLQILWSSGDLPAVIPEVPQPCGEHRAAEPLDIGPGYLESLFARFFARLSLDEKADLQAWACNEAQQPLRLASVCSGTDCPVLVWEAFASSFKDAFKQEFKVEHVFSAEKMPRKQDFLLRMYPGMPILFADCLELSGDVAWDVKSERQVLVPEAGCLFGGFPCTDASRLCNSSSSVTNRSCIKDGSLRTGSVFKSIIRWVKRHGSETQFIVLENVQALVTPPRAGGQVVGPDNLTVAVRMLSDEIGFFTKVFLLDPRLFGVPQSRSRLWLCAFRRSALENSGLTDDMAAEVASSVMGRLAGSKVHDLQDYLLDACHPLIAARHSDAEIQALLNDGDETGATVAAHGVLPLGHRTSTKRKASSSPSWLNKHLKLYSESGKDWWRDAIPDAGTFKCFPGLYALTEREFETLALSGVADFPEKCDRTIDVSQSIGRGSISVNGVQAITPSGRKYLTKHCRILLGVESLRLQSLFFADDRALKQFSNGLLNDLAGNAFEASCCAASALVCCLVLSHGAAARQLARASIPGSPTSSIGYTVTSRTSAPHSDTESDDLADVWGFWGV